MRLLPLCLAPLLMLNVAAQSAPAPVPSAFTTAPDGRTLVHVESGTRFPKKLGGFERTGQAAFDGSGEYVGVAYRGALDDGSPVTIRIAIVHIVGMTAMEHFIIAKPLVLKDLANVEEVSAGPYERPGKGVDGYMGMFNAEDAGQKVGIGLWTFDRGYWSVRGRVEFPQGRLKESQAAVDKFVRAFVALRQPYKTPPNAR
ncbi:hypothetical protein ACFB49_09680 [Sphingomonas sp. DBB INV C78]|uniref:hypothetical protein n=1 Tax=Sphingomonas sp. DBB INV C78 TaxID=3349434 RepID=UPI0036D2273A